MSAKLNLKSLAQSRQKKIDSPLAKYNSAGQLFCVLCNAQVKNEIYWTGHINGKQHKDTLAVLKSAKSSPTPQSLKRPAPQNTSNDDHQFTVPTSPAPKVQKLDTSDSVKKAEEELQRMIGGGGAEVVSRAQVEEQAEEEPQKTNELPAGFFDDPKEDAKARGMKFKDPQDVEWDKFVKEIASEDIKSNEIVGVEQEKSAVERELDHIEEQMAQWQR